MICTRTLIGVSLIFLIIQSASCIWQPNNDKIETLCNSDECKTRGKLYKNHMNDRVNPCEDFYDFTCGNWHAHHKSPKYSTDWSVLDVMVSNFAKVIRETLESYDTRLGGHVIFERAKEVYDICVKIPEYPKSEARDIAKEINKVGRLPRTRLWDIHTKYLKLTGESPFFRTTIVGEVTEGIPFLILVEPASAFGSILHDGPWKPEEEKSYTKFLFETIKSLNLPDSDTVIKERIAKVFEFRKKFSEIITRNVQHSSELLAPLTPQILETWFSDNQMSETNTQKIPWIKVMAALYHKLPAKVRQIRNLISMRQRQYFIDLMAFLKTEPEDVLAFHMEIYFIERHLKLNERHYKLLEGTLVEPHNKMRYIRERFYQRWESCIDNHNMKETLEGMVYMKFVQTHIEEDRQIRQLISDIKVNIYNQMCNSTWLDLRTRVDTLVRFNEVATWIGFPPWVTGMTNPEPRDMAEILKPNAELNIEQKFLYIYAPLLFSPVFDLKMPALYNYAGLGTTVGHELYHVINSCGSYPSGNETIDWWPRIAQDECYKRLESFFRTYNEVTDKEFKKRYNITDLNSNTMRTVLENFPDVMGLEAAYNVYKEATTKDESVCRTLPKFEEYSCDQMFYIGFANTFCGFNNKKSAMEKLMTARHSIDSVRINGAVAQMESFGTAFHCPVGSPMNPQAKVNLWK